MKKSIVVVLLTFVFTFGAYAEATSYDKICGEDEVVKVIQIASPEEGVIFLCGRKNASITGYVGYLELRVDEISFNDLELLFIELEKIAKEKKDIVFRAIYMR